MVSIIEAKCAHVDPDIPGLCVQGQAVKADCHWA